MKTNLISVMSLLTARRLPIGVAIVSAFFVLTGLYPVLNPSSPPPGTSHPISIQLALIRVSAWGPVHIAITLLAPLVSIVAGILFWLKRKAGWWLVALLSSLLGILYILAAIDSPQISAIFEGYFLLPSSIDVELFVRSILYIGAFIVAITKRVMALYLPENVNRKWTISLLLLGNIMFAVLFYSL